MKTIAGTVTFECSSGRKKKISVEIEGDEITLNPTHELIGDEKLEDIPLTPITQMYRILRHALKSGEGR